MGVQVYEASVAFSANASPLWRAIGSMGPQIVTRMGALGSAAGAAFSAGMTAGVTAGLAVFAGGGVLAAWSTRLASDAEEAGSKFGFVFGKAAEETAKQLDDFAAAAGRSRFELRSMAADVGALIGPMGFTADKTGALSVQVVKLAQDLSSFFNVAETDALVALRAAIVGESEPMRRLGVQLNEAKIQAEAFRLGLAKTKDQVAGMVKTQAILSIIMRETATAQGDAVRTAGSYANAVRALQGSIRDAGTEIGRLFLPMATEVVKSLRRGVDWLHQHADTLDYWGNALGEITGNVLNHLEGLSRKFTEFFGGSMDKLIRFATGGGIRSFKEFVTKTLDAMAVLTKDFSRTWEVIKTGAELAATTVSKFFVDTLRTGQRALSAAFAMLPRFIQDGAGAIIDGVNAVLNSIRSAFAIIASGFDALMDHIERRLTRFTKVGGFAGKVIKGMVGGFGGVAFGGSEKAVPGATKVMGAMPGMAAGKIDIRKIFGGAGGMLDQISADLGANQRDQVGRLFGLLGGFDRGRGAQEPAGPGKLPFNPLDAIFGANKLLGHNPMRELIGGARGPAAAGKAKNLLGKLPEQFWGGVLKAADAGFGLVGKAGQAIASVMPERNAAPKFESITGLGRSIQESLAPRKGERRAEAMGRNLAELVKIGKDHLQEGIKAVAAIKNISVGFGD